MKRCKCGNEPIYKNGELQLCSECLGMIWTNRISLEDYLAKWENSKNIDIKEIYKYESKVSSSDEFEELWA
ncbi:MAG: hypothetical protein E6356_14015 [Terrisporobacter othiniensis]|nr:hypothetical protein [Terrisporobacter othiniensis]